MNKKYKYWLLSDTAKELSVSIRSLALTLLVFSITGSAFLSGLFGTLTYLVTVILTPIGGAIVDSYSRIKLTKIHALISISIWFTLSVLIIINKIDFPTFMFLAILNSINQGLLSTAPEALLKSILDSQQYAKAASINQGRDAIVSLIGSPLSGLLYGLHPFAPFISSSILSLISILSISPIEENYSYVKNENLLRRIIQGLKYILEKKSIMHIITVLLITNFSISGLISLYHYYLLNEGYSSLQVGISDGAMALSCILGVAVFFPLVKNRRFHSNLKYIFFLLIFSPFPFILSNSYFTVISSLILLGLFLPICSALILGYIYTQIDENMQGRSHSVVLTLSSLLAIVSPTCAGYLANLHLYQYAVILFIAGFALSFVIVSLNNNIKNIEYTFSS